MGVHSYGLKNVDKVFKNVLHLGIQLQGNIGATILMAATNFAKTDNEPSFFCEIASMCHCETVGKMIGEVQEEYGHAD